MTDYHIFKKSVKSGAKTIQRWYYWYYDADGKQKNKVCKNCKTKQEALIYIDNLPPRNKTSLKIKDILYNMYFVDGEYQDTQKKLGKVYAEKTHYFHQLIARNIINDLGNMELSDLTVKKVVDYLAAQDIASTYKNAHITVIRRMYDYAHYNGYKIFIPKFPRFTNTSRKSDILTLDELKKLLVPENFNHKVYYLMTLLAFSTGMRCGEVRAFMPNQFVENNKIIIVNGFLDSKNKRINHNKKGSNENLRWRNVPLPDFTYYQLIDYINEVYCTPNELLFKVNGEPVTNLKILKELKYAMEKAGIIPNGRRLTFHSLRYSYVTHIRPYLTGENVQKLVGHTNISMTDYYTRASLEAALADFEKILPVVDKFFQKLTANN